MTRLVILVLYFSLINVFFAAGAFAERSEFAVAAEFVRQKNYMAAFDIYSDLAKQNDHDAQFNAAIFLKRGLGHPTHYSSALKWAWLAELGGIEKAKELTNELVAFIPEEEVDTVRLAVEQILNERMSGLDVRVLLQLSQFYQTISKEPDFKQAYALSALAAALKVEGALTVRDELENTLEPEDLVEAQNMAADLFNKNAWKLTND